MSEGKQGAFSASLAVQIRSNQHSFSRSGTPGAKRRLSVHKFSRERVSRKSGGPRKRSEAKSWCGGKDSNLHGIATASPSSWCVCQFRHHRKIKTLHYRFAAQIRFTG